MKFEIEKGHSLIDQNFVIKMNIDDDMKEKTKCEYYLESRVVKEKGTEKTGKISHILELSIRFHFFF